MNKADRDRAKARIADLLAWADQAKAADRHHATVIHAVQVDRRRLAGYKATVRRSGDPAWHVVPLHSTDTVVDRLVAHANLQARTADDDRTRDLLVQHVPRAVENAGPLLHRRLFVSAEKKSAAAEAIAWLDQMHAWMVQSRQPARLEALGKSSWRLNPLSYSLGDLLDPDLDFRIDGLGLIGASMVRSDKLADLPQALSVIERVTKGEAKFQKAARDAGDAVRRGETRKLLREMSVDTLKQATRDRLRLGPLAAGGITTVQQVLDRGYGLRDLPGVGEESMMRMLGAARTIERTTYDEMPVRIDVSNRTDETTELLSKLREWDVARQTRGAASDLERAAELTALKPVLHSGVEYLVVTPVRELGVEDLLASVDVVRRRAELLSPSAKRGTHQQPDAWDDFLSRPADYFAMLAELGFITEDEDATHGDLPEEIIQAVRDQPLEGEHLNVSLRGYQSFGARFALVQRKVIIGDEMGLGKTIEALAAIAHLRSRGETHFVVVCPAAVVTNWMREVASKSKLRAHRVHGIERVRAARMWERDGGVAVTTYETLAWWETSLARADGLACVVVDEAHYVKNPNAQRSRRTAALVEQADRAIFLTGTPLENRVDEFRNLVGYLRPDLTLDAHDLAPHRFKKQVAPAYLRRNQEDVLTELPELIEVNEWLLMSAADQGLYRSAVADGNFMAMRQAAMLSGNSSEKLQRLVEIVEEAEDNGRKVIVFSHFREVLATVARALPGKVFGPLTGSVPANQRQAMVDDFGKAPHGAVLVAQIVAGGVGLNIQSASVVVICEPQLKPTTEAQAIARAHRMGQVQSVQVHRLLSEEGVDQRVTEILAGKRHLFEEFARVSALAESTPEAVDLSEADLAREVVAAERQRLLGDR